MSLQNEMSKYILGKLNSWGLPVDNVLLREDGFGGDLNCGFYIALKKSQDLHGLAIQICEIQDRIKEEMGKDLLKKIEFQRGRIEELEKYQTYFYMHREFMTPLEREEVKNDH